MNPDFKDLLPWQEMSKAVKELERKVTTLTDRLDAQLTLHEILRTLVQDTDAQLQRGIDRLDRQQESIWKVINELQAYHN